jgi:uncharacterized protein
MNEKYPLSNLFWLVCIVLTGMLLGNVIGFFILLPSLDNNLSNVQLALSNPTAYPEIKLPMIFLQGLTALFSFILFPYIFSKLVAKSDFEIKLKFEPISLLLPVLITLAVIPVNGFFIDWNKNMNFPDFMSGIENWAMAKEKSLEELTLFLTNLTGIPELLLGIIVFALLPGIGEEYLFRGILQKFFEKKYQNLHVAIWLSAIIFSAIHFQFYGFVPRVLLGALFGYLYAWSGNLVVPIIAHFTNNATTVILIYLKNNNIITMDLDSTDSLPWYVILVSTLFLVFLIKLSFNQKKSNKFENA